jgi:hypothetical protein
MILTALIERNSCGWTGHNERMHNSDCALQIISCVDYFISLNSPWSNAVLLLPAQ